MGCGVSRARRPGSLPSPSPECLILVRSKKSPVPKSTLQTICFEYISNNLDIVVKGTGKAAAPTRLFTSLSLRQRQYALDLLVRSATLTSWQYSALLGAGIEEMVVEGYDGSTVDDSFFAGLGGGADTIKRVKIENCKLVGERLATGLRCCTGMEELSLRGCGSMSDSSVAASLSGCCHSLKSVDLAFVRRIGATTMGALAKCVGLNAIILEGCRSITQNQLLGVLNSLKTLRLFSLGKTGVTITIELAKAISALPLRELSLDTCIGVDGALPLLLDGLPLVVHLDLSGWDIHDVIASHFEACKSLRSCRVQNGKVRGSFFEAMSKLDVRFLDVSFSGVNDIHLASCALPHLISLSLDGCEVTDKSAEVITRMQTLLHLSLADTHLTPAGLVKLSKSPFCRTLESLNVFYTPAVDQDPSALSRFIGLRELNADGRQGGDRLLPYLKGMVRLQKLDIFGVRTIDSSLASLHTMRGLQWIEVCGGYLSDKGVDIMANQFPNLKHLNISQNGRITSAGLAPLCVLRLESLHVNQTKVDFHAVPLLSKMLQLRFFTAKGTNLRWNQCELMRNKLKRLEVLAVDA